MDFSRFEPPKSQQEGHAALKLGVGLMCAKSNACIPAAFKNEATAFQPTNVSFLGPELGKGASVRLFFQAAWFSCCGFASCSNYR